MAKTNRKKCPECKGKTQCDCDLCFGRGYLVPKKNESFLQPQQPDDQYPAVPAHGWAPSGPDSADKIRMERSLFCQKIDRMLRYAQQHPNKQGVCVFHPTDVGDILLRILLLESDRENAIRYAERLEERNKFLELDAQAIHTAVSVMGGTVEGRPTSRVNYLQRLRQLLEIEEASRG